MNLECRGYKFYAISNWMSYQTSTFHFRSRAGKCCDGHPLVAASPHDYIQEAIQENAAGADKPVKSFVPNRIAVSTYSFFTFRGGSKLTMPQCIDAAAVDDGLRSSRNRVPKVDPKVMKT